MKRRTGLTDHELNVPRETELRLGEFLTLLRRWNTKINLVGGGDDAILWRRHIMDSLQLAPLLPVEDGPLVDLGSGAGFPGLILALATGRETHLVEADRRKAAFLMEAARTLGLTRAAIHPTRIELAAPPPAAIVTARALAPLPDLMRHAHRLLAPRGTAIFPKGRTAEDELTAAARDWTMAVERFPSRTDPAATILRLKEIRPASAQA